MARFSALFALLGIMCAPAQAHLLKVFAFADGNRIQGSTYFIGGAPASGATVRMMNSDGDVLATIAPDADGEFGYEAKSGEDHIIVADTGDGHVAEWVVTAAELTSHVASTAGSGADSAPSFSETASAAAQTRSDLATLVEKAVARQIRPLREQIIANEEQVRLRDIVGGIGYIIGLAGLSAWWQQHRRRNA